MKAHLTRSEGFFDLGMYDDAWKELEKLPPIDRVEPLVLELRLRILTATEKWELGDHIANVLVSSAVELQKCRGTVARFRHAYARHLCKSGLVVLAREQARLSVEAWEPIRPALLDDDGLAGIWEI